MKIPLVSIIVPVYNVEKYLDRCMDTVLNQTLKDIEIILVDDGSPDNCPVRCDEYSDLDPRIKVIHKENAGLGYARNSGLEVATGEYVAFIDSDDFVDISMYEELYSVAKKNSCDSVFCGYFNLDNRLKAEPVSEVLNLTTFDTPKKIQNVLLDMIACKASSRKERKFRMSVWHSIYSRKLIEDNKIKFVSEREYISEDIFFHIDYLTKSSKIAFVPTPLYYYCYNDNSLTKTFRNDRFKKHKILYKGMLKKINSQEYYNNIVKQRVNRFFIGYVRSNMVSICKAQISYNEKRRLIKEICYDNIWESLKDYPYYKMPLVHKTIMKLIKYKMVTAIIVIMRIL